MKEPIYSRLLPMPLEIFIPVYIIGHAFLLLLANKAPHVAIVGPGLYLLACMFFTILDGINDKKILLALAKMLVAIAFTAPLIYLVFRHH